MASQLLTESISLLDESEELTILCETHRVVDDARAAAIMLLGEPIDLEGC